MGLDLVFVHKQGGFEPDIPRYCGHREFLDCLNGLDCLQYPETTGYGEDDPAFRPLDIAEAVRRVSANPECQPGHLRILWQLRHDPNLYLAVSY